MRTVLSWSEHCTECVWPTCYSSCELYVPRVDGRCRRFKDGMVRIDVPFCVNSYLLKIRFKRWGKLWSPGNVVLHSSREADLVERKDYRIGKTLHTIPLPSFLKNQVVKRRYGSKKNRARSRQCSDTMPTCFLLECYNPEDRTIQMSLIMRPTEGHSMMPFQKRLDITPGFHRYRIPLSEITALVDVQSEFDIELIPNHDSEECTLYFGLVEFVVEAPSLREPGAKKVKCVVWDLDDTLWDGVLVERGGDNLQLKAGISSVIRGLDARGILNSIASKNSPEEAWEVVKKLDLDEYFIFPQISWAPKSQAIQAIARELNIGLDSLLFIDDSRFEREEVHAACPQVRILPADSYPSLLDRDELNVPVTEESKARRKLYQVEMDRQSVAKSFNDDYMAFLQHCQIKLNIGALTVENLERVHELTQRTNQMNFSGNRYDRQVLRAVLQNPYLDTFVLSCEDRFGSYGIIGFSIVDRRKPLMTDLMFSCRVQSKRVEHAFLAFIIRKYTAEIGKDFYANYRQTPRNAASGQVFTDLRMEEVGNLDGLSLLRFSVDSVVCDDGVIDIITDENLIAEPA